MPLANKSYWYYDTLGPDNAEFVREQREVSMVTRIRDWDADSNDYYIIEFKSVFALNLARLTDDIPADIFTKIKDPNSQCYMILENFHEGFNRIIPEIYAFVIDKYKIPAAKVILWSGALDIQKQIDEYALNTGKEKFKYASMIEFEFSVQSDYFGMFDPKGGAGGFTFNTLESKPYPKKYLNFNRRWRLHRPLLTALLKCVDRLDDGYVSLSLADDSRGWDTELDYIVHEAELFHTGVGAVLHHNKSKIANIGNLTLDKPDLSINQAALEITKEIQHMYENTYFSVVSETIFFTDYWGWEDSCFLSEKIFKAILFRHPFVLVATPHTLKHLRAIGYKTYSPVIDESYDSVEDNYERLIAITKEIDRLCKLKGEALDDYLKYCKEIADHNYKLLTTKKQFIYNHYDL